MEVARTDDDNGVLYRGGPIRTMDPAAPSAEALATRAGEIVAVGTEEVCRRALGLSPGDDGRPGGPGQVADVVDLAGRALLPGFNDAHTNPMRACFFARSLDLGTATCLAEVLDALADRARDTTPGEWVIGVHLNARQLREGRLPDIGELDQVGAGRPVVLLLRDGHSSIGNTVALAAAGIRGSREAPPGGWFERDELGRLTGVCHEAATGVLLGAVPIPDLSELVSVATQLFADLAALGVTSVGAALQTDAEGPGGAAAALESVGMMLLDGAMPQGCHAMLCGDPDRAVDLRRSSSLHEPGENRVVGGVKLFIDGTLGPRTAWLHQPYADAPAKRGMFTGDAGEASRRMERAHLAGMQICVHAVGDAAVHMALDLFDDLFKLHPSDPARPPRHRIEHASVLDDAAIERLGALGIATVVPPLALRCEGGWLHDRLGGERSRLTYPLRSLRDAGVTVAGASDAPARPWNPLAGMHAAVTRHGFQPDQALTVAEAAELFTRQAAYVQHREAVTGTLTEGKRADLVVLSEDPLGVPPEHVADIEVHRTVIGGEVAYARPGT